MLANIHDLTAFKNHLLNDEIDEAKSLLARKQASFKDVTRAAKETLETLPRDDLGTSLIPEDVTLKQGEHMLALQATPNGDCLFNAASILFCGHESLSTLLRLLVAGELYFNATFYADHETFSETARSNPELDQDVLFLIALTKRGDQRFTASKDKVEAVKEEAFVACEKGEWSSLMHLMGLSSVMSTPIFSIYPDVCFRYRCLMHRIINPRQWENSLKLTDVSMNILWSRDGNLDTRAGSWYQPNHFVPIVLSNSSTDKKPDCPTSNADDTRKAKQQGTLFSFLKPKATAAAKPKATAAAKPKATAAANPKATTATSSSGKFQKRTASAAGLEDKTEVKQSTSTLKQKLLKWKGEFPWLTISEDGGTVRCSVCCDVPEVAGDNQFVTGCKPTKRRLCKNMQ